jgi:hypothetical protein
MLVLMTAVRQEPHVDGDGAIPDRAYRVPASRGDVLPAIVAVAFAARVVVAIASPHIIWPDEHFQVLEPANRIVNGYGTLTWEWDKGIRNWVMPGLHIPLLYALRLLGIRGGPIAIDACRVLAAAVSSVALLRFGRLLRLRGVSPPLVLAGLFPLLFLPHMLAWGAATFADTWATSILWIGLAPALRALETPGSRARAYFFIGLWLSAIFGVRFTMGFWIAPFVAITFLCYRPLRILVPAMGAGFALGILSLGMLDWVTLGGFLSSPRAYYQSNIVEGVAASMGVSPWTSYVESASNDLGRFTIYVAPTLFVTAVVTRSLRPTRIDAAVLVPALVFLVVHCVVRHKEARFILPAYPALLYGGAVGASGLLRWAPRVARLAALAARPRVPLMVGAIAFSVWSWVYFPFDGIYHSLGATDVTFAAYRDGLLRDQADGCVIEMDDGAGLSLYARGQMGFGVPTAFQNIRLESQPRPDLSAFRECRYALVLPAERHAFDAIALPLGWKWLVTGVSGVRLYRRAAPR